MYKEALAYLQDLEIFGMNFGLARIRELLRLLDEPQTKYKTVHVTGSNGKGSVCAMLASCMREAKIHVGMFTSPHLSSYTERVMIDGEPVSERDFAEAIFQVKDMCEFMTRNGNEHPTQFEVLTAAAFLLFQKAEVEYAIIEVGLGGLVDSTNVIVPELAVITNVSLEHADKCGGTLAGVAEHKAGIIKANVPVVTGAQGEPLAIIRQKAEELQATCYVLGEDFAATRRQASAEDSLPPHLGYASYLGRETSADMKMEALSKLTLDVSSSDAHSQLISFTSQNPVFAPLDYKLSLLGVHQVTNSAVAVAAFMVLAMNDLRFTQRALKNGLKKVTWAGRFELLEGYPHKVLVDGAHNPDGIAALRASLDEYFPQEKRIFVLGILKDKDYPQMLGELLREEDTVILTRPVSARAAVPSELLPYIKCKAEVEEEPEQALARALPIAKDENDLLICTGSLYLVGALRELLLRGVQVKI